jgi:hypothetical protein
MIASLAMTLKRIVLICAVMCSMDATHAQTLKKYPIDASGCSIYVFCNPGKFDVSMSPDSSKVYSGECVLDSVYYDVICVKMKERIADLAGAEDLLVQYLDYLKSSFRVTGAAGYGKGHRLKGKETTRGIVDYWQDEGKNNIKVKGWTDGTYIAVAMAITAKEIPESKANVFLDGIVFPEIKK